MSDAADPLAIMPPAALLDRATREQRRLLLEIAAAALPRGHAAHYPGGISWTAERQQAVRAEYEAAILTVQEIAEIFGTSPGRLQKYARAGNWRRRCPRRCRPGPGHLTTTTGVPS